MRDCIDEYIYIHIDEQHCDTMRFVKDCEFVLKKPVQILQSEYKSVENVLKKGFINSPYGAECTRTLKTKVREKWERTNKTYDITYVWGYDCTEKDRAIRIIEKYDKYSHVFPLMDKMLSKEDAHGILARIGIARPVMYDLGYNNNNCVPCVKGGMGYWNKIRIDYPDKFNRFAKLERTIGASCINGVYLDELAPSRGNIARDVPQECSILCHVAMYDM